MDETWKMIHLIRGNGEEDLVFEGSLMAEASDRNTMKDNRWTEVRVYKTSSGTWAVSVIRRTNYPGEMDVHDAREFPDLSKVKKYLDGIPTGKQLLKPAGDTGILRR